MSMPSAVISASQLGATLREFLRWWAEALRSLIPQAWRRAWSERRPTLVLELSTADAVLRRRAGRQETTLFQGPRAAVGDAPAGDAHASRLIVALAPDLVFRRTIRLPVAVETNLPRVIANELDRQIPFSRDQVDFDYRVAGRDPAARQIAVEIVAARRAVVDELVALAARWSAELHGVGVSGLAPGDGAIDLLRRRRAAAPASRVAWLNAGLAAAAAALAMLVTASAVQQLDDEIAALSSELREARRHAQQADTLRREIHQLADAAGFLARRKHAASALTVLREVTAVLPDAAWTFEFQLHDGQTRIAGYAADAPGLIARLEKSSVLRDPRFRAPVTRIANRDLERFDLSVDVQPHVGGQP